MLGVKGAGCLRQSGVVCGWHHFDRNSQEIQSLCIVRETKGLSLTHSTGRNLHYMRKGIRKGRRRVTVGPVFLRVMYK